MLSRMKWFTIAALGAVPFAFSFAQAPPSIEVSEPTWEKGITEITFTSRHTAQRSGALAETIIKARCEGVLREVSDADGKSAAVLKNSSSTAVGFNWKPAVEVNVIYLVVRTSDEKLRVFENLSSVLVRELAAVQHDFKPEDNGYFFLTSVGNDRITVEFRGEKKLHPRINPFSFDMDIGPNGDLKLRPDSVKR
jgi:hypothetical protein